MKKIAIYLLIWFFFAINNLYAGNILDFIIANNPELQELKTINSNILKQLKLEATGRVSYGQLTREGTTTLEQAQTRYDVGVIASLPLISPSEKSQRKIEYAQKERIMRLEVAELVKQYYAEKKTIEEENKILISLYNELQWIRSRVEAGIDNQKEYNQKHYDYMNRRKKYELKKEQLEYILEKILSYVSADKREELRGMLQ